MSRLSPDADDARFIRRVVILILIVAVTAALYRAGDLLILAFGSMLGAIVIHAIAETYRDKLRLPEKIALGLSMLTVIAALSFLVWLFGVQFRAQLNLLIVKLPGILQQFSAWASQSPVGAKIVDAAKAAYAGSKAAQDVGGILLGSGELFINVILLLFGSLFFAVEPKKYERGLLLLVPPSKRPAFEDALFDVGSTLRLWLRAQIIEMTTMGVLVGVGLWIAKVPSAAALGLLAGLSEFIPYIGPTAAMLPALGLAATSGTGPVIGTLITYAIVRVIQTNFVTPFVTSRVVFVPPAVTLFAILSIGAVFGLFGLFFSMGLLVAIFTLVRTLYLREVLGEDIPPVGHDRMVERDGRLTGDSAENHA